jgi:hypothetical protein
MEILNGIGIIAESWNGTMFKRLNPGETLDGRMSQIANTLFKVSGMDWVNDVNRASFGALTSHLLANNRKVSWEKLGKDLQRELGRFNITGEKWNLIRKTAKQSDDGKWWVSPDYVKNIDNDLIKKTFKLKSDRQVADFKHNMEIELASYFQGQVDDAIFMPGVKETFTQTAGKKRGTTVGEIARFFMQFKSFPLMAVKKGIYRTAKTKGIPAMANLILWTTGMGYLAGTAKDLVAGKKPKDPIVWTKKDGWREEGIKTWAAAFAQGGSLGIYADFLTNARSKYGGTVISTSLGPTADLATQLIDTFIGKPKEGNFDKIPKDTLRILKQNLPYQNLWYTRLLLDHYIMNGLQEAINPGYTERKENWAKKEYNQEYWLPPTESPQF